MNKTRVAYHVWLRVTGDEYNQPYLTPIRPNQPLHSTIIVPSVCASHFLESGVKLYWNKRQ